MIVKTYTVIENQGLSTDPWLSYFRLHEDALVINTGYSDNFILDYPDVPKLLNYFETHNNQERTPISFSDKDECENENDDFDNLEDDDFDEDDFDLLSLTFKSERCTLITCSDGNDFRIVDFQDDFSIFLDRDMICKFGKDEVEEVIEILKQIVNEK